jgi:hypothetical protein
MAEVIVGPGLIEPHVRVEQLLYGYGPISNFMQNISDIAGMVISMHVNYLCPALQFQLL